jgi:hypothetical protein
VEAALVLLERMGLSPAGLAAVTQDRTEPDRGPVGRPGLDEPAPSEIRQRRGQFGDLGDEQVLGDSGAFQQHAARTLQSAGQGRRPQVLDEQHGGRGARAEFAGHEVEVIGTDQATDLAVDRGCDEAR